MFLRGISNVTFGGPNFFVKNYVDLDFAGDNNLTNVMTKSIISDKFIRCRSSSSLS